MTGFIGLVDFGWATLLPWAAALHAVALPAAAAISVARFRATVPPPVRWVAVAGGAGAVSALLLGAAIRLASPRAAETLIATFGPPLGGIVVLLFAAFTFSLVERHWATGIVAALQGMALAIATAPLSFLTTPGAWPVSHAATDAIANPTFLPLLLGRLSATAIFCGACLLLCATRGGDPQRPRALAAGTILSLAGAATGAASAWLWLRAVGPRPLEELFGDARLVTGAARLAIRAIPAFALLALFVALVSATRFSAIRRAAVALLLLAAVAGVGAAELARVALSGGWIVGVPGQGWLLANGLTREESEAARRSGLASVRPDVGASGAEPSAERGGRVFALACTPCHSERGMTARFQGWPRATIAAAVDRLDRLAPGSPPFPGDRTDARDLVLHFAMLDGRLEGEAAPPEPALVEEGKRLFAANCDHCHREVRLDRRVAGWNEPLARLVVGRLHRINPAMPRFGFADGDRRALAAWLVTVGAPPPSPAPSSGEAPAKRRLSPSPAPRRSGAPR